jgi:cytochrome P450
VTGTPGPAPPEHRDGWDFQRDPALATDPQGALEQLRGRGTFWTTANKGHWVITDPEQIRAALQDPASFSSRDVNIPGSAHRRRMVPVELDPPDHGKYRTMLAPFFSPAAASKMDDQIERYCAELLDRITPLGRCEFVADFATQLPAMLFLGLFDLPVADAPAIDAHLQAMSVRTLGASPHEGARWLDEYVRAVVEDRIAHPGRDLVSQLLACELGGLAVTPEEVGDLLFLLLIAGLDTTTGVMAFGWHHLATHQADRARLAADPGIVPTAVEEILRHYTIVNIGRVVSSGVCVDGVALAPGDRVLLPVTLAHRLGDDSDGVRLDLGPRRHSAFGAGPHRCLGSHLARRELAIALRAWHQRIPEYDVAADTTVDGFGGAVMGLRSLHLSWT